ncbi:MAG TPA: hypothetical protein VFY05_10270 [Candidatus Angelobacter sp.]|nr:hypothetical protein [Candidatus Angelobacter sp.]
MSDSPPGSGDPQRKLVLPADTALDRLIHESDPEILAAVAADSRLTEDLALAMLERRDLPREALEQLHRNSSVAKLRKVRLAVVTHPRTPRHVSIPNIRHLYLFELMQVALMPALAPDLKRAAEETLLGRMATISSGERLTLAKRSSGRVAAALLLDKEEHIMQAALLNPQMTEMWIVKALKAGAGAELLSPAVCRHSKWLHRLEIKAALLGNRHTPFAFVVQIANELPLHALKDVLRNAQLAPNVKAYLQGMVDKRSGKQIG